MMVNEVCIQKFFGKLQKLYTTEITGAKVGLVYAYFMALISLVFFFSFCMIWRTQLKKNLRCIGLRGK